MKNYCYECGNDCGDYSHFCDRECLRKFGARSGNDRVRVEKALMRQTKLRKKLGKPRFVGNKK